MISSNTDFDTEVTLETASHPLPEDPPFRILLLGNWSGRDQGDLPNSFPYRPFSVDRDNFDEALAKFNVGLDLDLARDGKNSLSLQFRTLDDFHPDSIFGQVPLFADLRDMRRRLVSEDSYNEAATEVRRLFDLGADYDVSDSSAPPIESEPFITEQTGLLDNILSRPAGEVSAKRSKATPSRELGRFLSNILKSHIVETDEDEQAKLLKLVDEATSELMRSILHHPKFQELEASWRGVYFLVRKIETDVDLKIFLLDVSKSTLSDNLKGVSSLADSKLYEWLVRDTIGTPGAEPWAVVCGNFTFEVGFEDVAALIRIAKISEAANAPFVSHISAKSFGISGHNETAGVSGSNFRDGSSENKLWEALRSVPEARFLGLAIPRYLARLPYGQETDPTESFSFEEFKGVSEHDNYLWSNPSFICGFLLAETYRKFGWEMSRGFELSVSGLPTHIFLEDGETRTKPCAEILMTEVICQKILDEGLMPLISFKNSDRVQLGRFQSVASPFKALAGRWS